MPKFAVGDIVEVKNDEVEFLCSITEVLTGDAIDEFEEECVAIYIACWEGAINPDVEPEISMWEYRGDDPEPAYRGATPQLHGMAGPFRGPELDFRSPTRRECLEPLPSSPPAGRWVEDHTDRWRSVRRERGGQWPFPWNRCSTKQDCPPSS